MTRKENKGGLLSNEQVEQDLKVNGGYNGEGGYHGSQDTGDDDIRQGKETEQKMPDEEAE